MVKYTNVLDFEILKKVEQERHRIISILKEYGITENSEGKRIEDLYLLPLTMMKNTLLPNID